MSDGTPNICSNCNGVLRYLNGEGNVASIDEKTVEFGCPECDGGE